MKTINIRHKFATNSSSLHSVVLLDKRDIDVYESFTYHDAMGSWGWDMFSLDGIGEKLAYMIWPLVNQIRAGKTDSSMETSLELIVSKLKLIYSTQYLVNYTIDAINSNKAMKSPVDMMKDFDDCLDIARKMVLGKDTYIDHQSNFSYPVDRHNTASVHLKYARNLILSIALNNNIRILGGNDNSGPQDEVLDNLKHSKIMQGCLAGTNGYGNIVVKKDTYMVNNGASTNSPLTVWTLFNKRTGFKTKVVSEVDLFTFKSSTYMSDNYGT